jgi:thioredoxin reductase (NADPH)
MSDVREVIVIGSGPTGYTAAVYTARANLAPLVFTGSVEAGGALMNTTEVENFPGFPEGIMGPDLMMNMRAQAERFGAELVEEDVVEVDLTGPDQGRQGRQRRRVPREGRHLGDGLGLPPPAHPGRGQAVRQGGLVVRDVRRLLLPQQEHRGHRRRRLRRRGGHLPEPLRRHRHHDRPPRRAACQQDHGRPRRSRPEDQHRVGLGPRDDQRREQRQSLTVRNVKTDETTDIPVQGVFVAIGHDPRSALVRGQVDLDDAGYVLVKPGTQETNLPGVFAAGDLVDHTYRQAITAAGTGCAAALDAERYLASLGDVTAAEGLAAALANL